MEDSVTVKIGNNGRFVIPKKVRRSLNLADGDPVQLSVSDGKLIISPADTLLKEFFELTEGLRKADADPV